MGRVMIIRRSKRIYRREGGYASTIAFIFNANAASLYSLSEEASYIHLKNSKSHKATLIIYDMKSALIFLPKCHAELPNNAMLTELDDCVARREHRG